MLLTEWKEANLRTVAQTYPRFTAVEPPLAPAALMAWDGVLQPFTDCRELALILEDLRMDRTVMVSAGTLSHNPACNAVHQPVRYLDKIRPANAHFNVRVLAFAPKRHPKVFGKSPEISKRRFPSHRHINQDGSICPYSAAEIDLPWDGQTVRTFLDYTAVWSAKHHVWEVTGAEQGSIWLGSEAPHSPTEVMRAVGRNDPCPCGSGLKFKRCHLAAYESQRTAVPM